MTTITDEDFGDDDYEPLNDNPKDDQCLVCGSDPTDGTSGAGERVCATCGAHMQRHGEDVAWDDDCDQTAEMTPALCGYCGAEVQYSIAAQLWEAGLPGSDCPAAPRGKHDPGREVNCGYCRRWVYLNQGSGLYTLDGSADRWTVVCGESPDNRHDPDGDPD